MFLLNSLIEKTFKTKRMPRSATEPLLAGLLIGLCLSDPTSAVHRKFSTKTTYESSVAQDNVYYNETQMNNDELALETCKPVQMVGLLRHGIRNPGEKDITNIAKVIFKMKSAGVDLSEVEKLEEIGNRFLMEEAKDLAPTGNEELFNLGRRFGSRWLEMLVPLTPSDVNFVASGKSRAIASCENFKRGFMDATGVTFDASIATDDLLLRFFDECPKYVMTVAENKSAEVEGRKFQEQILKGINLKIARHLGVDYLNFDRDELKSILVVAGTEVAVFGSSLWSDLLSDEDLEQLEYAADIKNYWKKGYGHSVNYEPSCVLLRHMFQQMDDFISRKEKRKAVFYFGHTETVIPILSVLGLFRDREPLTADNFDRQSDRQFRTTRIAPFASNVAFLLYDCFAGNADSSPIVDDDNRYKLQLLFKERPLILPACGRSSSVCLYSTVRIYYSQYIDKCNFNALCTVAPPPHGEL